MRLTIKSIVHLVLVIVAFAGVFYIGFWITDPTVSRATKEESEAGIVSMKGVLKLPRMVAAEDIEISTTEEKAKSLSLKSR